MISVVMMFTMKKQKLKRVAVGARTDHGDPD